MLASAKQHAYSQIALYIMRLPHFMPQISCHTFDFSHLGPSLDWSGSVPRKPNRRSGDTKRWASSARWTMSPAIAFSAPRSSFPGREPRRIHTHPNVKSAKGAMHAKSGYQKCSVNSSHHYMHMGELNTHTTTYTRGVITQSERYYTNE